MRVLAAYVSSERLISITQTTKQKKHNINTKFIVLDSWLGVLLAAPGVRIGGGPPAAGEQPPYSWIIMQYFWYSEYHIIVCCLGCGI